MLWVYENLVKDIIIKVYFIEKDCRVPGDG